MDESVCDTESMWGGSDESWEPSDEDEEELECSDGLEARRARCYSLAPFCDLESWRGRLIVNPVALYDFCEQTMLPQLLLSRWIRANQLEDTEPKLQFFTQDSNGVKPDPFFIHMGHSGEIHLTRGCQRFLMELDEAHGRRIREWGQAIDDDDCYVDEEAVEARSSIVEWVKAAREAWGERYQKYIGVATTEDAVGEKCHGRHGKSKSQLRDQHLSNLEKKLRTKKGKANLVRRTKKQKQKDKQATNASLDPDEFDSDISDD